MDISCVPENINIADVTPPPKLERQPCISSEEPVVARKKPTRFKTRFKHPSHLYVQVRAKFGTLNGRVELRAGEPHRGNEYRVSLTGCPSWTVHAPPFSPAGASEFIVSVTLASSIIRWLYTKEKDDQFTDGDTSYQVNCSMNGRDGCCVGDSYWPDFRAHSPADLGVYLLTKIELIGCIFV